MSNLGDLVEQALATAGSEGAQASDGSRPTTKGAAAIEGLKAKFALDLKKQWCDDLAADMRKRIEIGKPLSSQEATFKVVERAFDIALSQVTSLHVEVTRLKMAPTLTYRGVWSEGTVYVKGNFVTFAGALWHANCKTSQKPGDGNKDFTLAVKRGKDAVA